MRDDRALGHGPDRDEQLGRSDRHGAPPSRQVGHYDRAIMNRSSRDSAVAPRIGRRNGVSS